MVGFSAQCGSSPDWKLYNGSCYYVNTPKTGPDSRKTWFEAKDYCVQQGGDLASIHTIQENGFLVTLVSTHLTLVSTHLLLFKFMSAEENRVQILDELKYHCGSSDNDFDVSRLLKSWVCPVYQFLSGSLIVLGSFQ